MRHGTWTETGGGEGGRLAFLAVIAAVLLGSGAAAAAASAIVEAVMIAGGAVALLTVALAVLVVYRIRHQEPQAAAAIAERAALVRAERYPAEAQIRHAMSDSGSRIGQVLADFEPARELHQHVHYHWHGTEDRAPEILRRSPRPE